MPLGVTVTLDKAPVAIADQIPSGRSFITLYAGGVSIMLPGFDAELLTAARSLSTSLLDAITVVESALAAISPPIRSTPMEDETKRDDGAVAEETAAEDTKSSDQADGATQDPPPVQDANDEKDGAPV